MKRRFLVIVHAGDQSQHPQWLATTDARSWDLVVHYHGTNPRRFPSDGDGMIRIDGTGPKWPALARLLAQTREVWKGYDFVWLPDDDLGVSGAGIDRMFALMAGLDLHLAQPAIAWTSPVSDVLTLHNPRFAVRYSSFVDVGAVALSTPLLSRILPTLSESVSGTGLGDLWAQKLDTPASQCAILDCVQVTRSALGAAHRAAAGSDGAAETIALLQRHGIAAPVRLAYGGLDADGRRTTLFDRANDDFLVQLCEGYRRLAGVSQQQLGLIFEQHAKARDDFLKVAAAPVRPPRADASGDDALGLPADYRSRTTPVYFDDDGATSDRSGQVWQPDVYALVASLATASGARRVVDIGCGRADKLMALADRFETVGVDFGANLDDCRSRHPAARWLKMDLEHVEPGDIAPLVDGTTVVVCSDVIEHLVDPRPLARALAALVGRAAAVVISTPERVLTRGAADRGPPANQCHVREWALDEFADFLGRCGFRALDFHGLTRSTTAREDWFTIVSVVAGGGARTALAEATGRAALPGRNYSIVKALARTAANAPVQPQSTATVQAAFSPASATPVPRAAAPRASAAAPARRFLALFRAGPKSLHPHAVAGLMAQNFDYALSYFGDQAPDADGAIFAHRADGAKWPGLEQTLIAHRDTIARYDYVWLPDDDLLCDPAAISRMFMICSELKLDLAQPALTSDSYYTHLVTLEHKAFQLRFTNFVEIMAPIFSAAFLARIVPTLAGNLSGWGLDALWPRMSRLGRVAIIDATPVKHTRPVCKGNYPANLAAGVPAHVEDWLTAAASFIETQPDFHINLGGLLTGGESIAIGASGDQINTFLGHLISSLDAMKQKVPPLYFARYLANHLSYWQGGELGKPRYPRDVVRTVLNQTLAPLGIAFPRPQAPVASPA